MAAGKAAADQVEAEVASYVKQYRDSHGGKDPPERGLEITRMLARATQRPEKAPRRLTHGQARLAAAEQEYAAAVAKSEAKLAAAEKAAAKSAGKADAKK